MAPYQKFANFFLILLAFCAGVPGSNGNVHEKKLLSALFSKYKNELRPVYYPQDTLKVQLGAALIHLQDLCVKDQHMTVTVWIRLVWKDASLKWDQAQFGNISLLRVRPSMVWVPDLRVENTADDQYKIPKRTHVLIYPSGEVLWVPPAMFKVKCIADSTYFPFDQQTCTLKFSSASYNGRELSFSFYNDKPFIDLADYWKSDQWSVVEVPGVINVYQSTTEVYTIEDITFYFTFRRKLINYVITLLLLSILLAVITVLPFILPDEKSEKLILELGSLVGALIILMHVRTVVTNAHRAIICKYLLTIVALNLVSIVFTVGAIYFNVTHKPMPRLLQNYVLRYLSRVFIWRKRSPKPQTAPPSAIEDASAVELNAAASDKRPDGDTTTSGTDKEKWKQLALIMDRSLFVIYLLIILISTIVLLSYNRTLRSDQEDAVIQKNTG